MRARLKSCSCFGESWLAMGRGTLLFLVALMGFSGAVFGAGSVGLGEYFIGTTANESFELRVGDSRAFKLIPDLTSPSIIGGHPGNFVTAGAVGATIAGGGDGTDPLDLNRVTDDFGFVGGGSGNIAGNAFGVTTDRSHAAVGGGSHNLAWGSHSFIGGGLVNSTGSVTGTSGFGFYAVVVGGATNQANANNSSVGGGLNNRANGYFSTIPGGSGSIARLRGQWAYGGGSFNNEVGSAQISTYTMRGLTSDATPLQLLIDASDLLTIEAGQTWTLEVTVVARSGAGDSAGYRIDGLLENVSGVTTLLASTMTILHEDDATWNVVVSADDANDALAVTVTGKTATLIRWLAKVETVEVTY